MIAVAAAIYLVDCVVLLERGQALWARTSLMFGSNHYQLRGRAVALLNPLTPFIPAFRTLPLFAGCNASNPAASEYARALSPLSMPSLLQMVLILVILPYCLYRTPGWPFFAALALAYASAAMLLGLLWWRLRRARIGVRPLAGLAFGALVCLPLSVNVLRKAALAFDIAMDARDAIGLLPEPARARARGELAAQAGEAMHEFEEGDARRRRLAELQAQLTAEAGHERG